MTVLNVQTRYAIDPNSAKSLDTSGLRAHFHVAGLFQAGEINLVYSHYDRFLMGGVMPSGEPLVLDQVSETGTATVLERREMGILNIGQTASVIANDVRYTLETGDILYLGKGSGPITFDAPGKFYVASTPAHQKYRSQLMKPSEGRRVNLGSKEGANERTIIQLLHPDVIETCQLVMGYTQLETGSVWNTMPAHTHDRRMEAYLYFDMDEDACVFHLMGSPQETRHLVVRNEEAVISPPWSIHSGAGTEKYTFCWAMGGDNIDFTDMDMVEIGDLR